MPENFSNNTIPAIDISIQTTQEELVFGAVEWLYGIIDNYPDYYEFHGTEAKTWLDAFEQIIANKPQSFDDGFMLLKSFAEIFLNNPYYYEYGYFHKSPLITSGGLSCYFVTYLDVPVPVRFLSDTYGVDIEAFLQKFLNNSNDVFTQKSKYFLNMCDNILKQNQKQKIGVFSIVFSVLLCLFACIFGYCHFLDSINWSLLPGAFKSGANVFQIIGYLTQETSGLNLNCSLSVLIVLLAFLWLIGGIFLGVNIIKRIKNIFNVAQKNKSITELEKTRQSLAPVASDHSNNSRILDVVDRTGTHKDSWFTKKSLSFSEILNLQKKIELLNSKSNPKKHLPGGGKLVFLFVLMLLTLLFGNLTKTETFIARYNMLMQSITHFVDERALRAKVLYCVKKPTPIFSGVSQNSIETYILNPNRPFEIIKKSDQAERAFQIKFDTEFGIMTGWLHNAELFFYNSENNMSLTKIKPDNSSASSTGAGSVVYLSNSSSALGWCEGVEGSGIGESVEFTYESTVAVKYLMIEPGNGVSERYYLNNGRPSEITVDFSNGDVLAERISIPLDGSKGKQFIRFNQTIHADKVRVEIKDVINGEKTDNTYISCLAVYEETSEAK